MISQELEIFQDTKKIEILTAKKIENALWFFLKIFLIGMTGIFLIVSYKSMKQANEEMHFVLVLPYCSMKLLLQLK